MKQNQNKEIKHTNSHINYINIDKVYWCLDCKRILTPQEIYDNSSAIHGEPECHHEWRQLIEDKPEPTRSTDCVNGINGYYITFYCIRCLKTKKV